MRFSAFVFMILLVGCGLEPSEPSVRHFSVSDRPDPAHNSRNSLDYWGVYQGTVPCADCAGIEMTLVIHENDTYERFLKYLGKGDSEMIEQRGSFEWNEAGSAITLEERHGSTKYRVGETALLQLNTEGEVITGDLADKYVLEKR